MRILQRRQQISEYTEDLLAQELRGLHLPSVDRGLIQELTYGVVRWEATLDWLIQRKAPGRTQKAALQVLLQLGLYQLFWLERIPDHAAVNESVALARRLGFGPQSGFINAVLRGYLREREATERLLADLKVQQPALGYSHPEWLFDRWEKRWGREHAIQLMNWNNQPPKTFARVNTIRIQPEQLLEIWTAEGVVSKPVKADWISENLIFELGVHPPLAELPSFKKGFFYVQDPSTLLAVSELAPQPGESVLDLCAAPGGKTTYMAQLINNRGGIAAQDVSPERLRRIEENCSRLGITCVRTMGAPDTIDPAEARQFDRALLDAPCSNTGVMRRRVDLRWRIRPQEIERLKASQLGLLRKAALQLKPAGRLIYSTCSLEPEENRGIVDLFLSEHRDFKLFGEREILPFVSEFDGAYVAHLSRGGPAVIQRPPSSTCRSTSGSRTSTQRPSISKPAME